jgi:hypothetical protein
VRPAAAGRQPSTPSTSCVAWACSPHLTQWQSVGSAPCFYSLALVRPTHLVTTELADIVLQLDAPAGVDLGWLAACCAVINVQCFRLIRLPAALCCRWHRLLHWASAGQVHEQQQGHPHLPRHWPGCVWALGPAAGVCAAVHGAVLLLRGLPHIRRCEASIATATAAWCRVNVVSVLATGRTERCSDPVTLSRGWVS